MTSLTVPYERTTAELTPPQQDGGKRTLSRSPHPYHRRSSSLQKPQRNLSQLPTNYSESSDSTESEERGTEADDEKGPILKGLPAPPLRGRKGLKGSRTPLDITPSISPFPTPPAVNDRRFSYFTISSARKPSKTTLGVKEQTVEEYTKYVNRRRAEIARRGTEGALLLLISIVACKEAFTSGQLEILFDPLWDTSVTLFCVYLLYPLHITFIRLQSNRDVLTAFKAGFHIPSRFDPGPLLYPVILPFLISVSGSSIDTPLVVTNIALGITSLPHALIPYSSSPIGEYLQWILSFTPFIRTTISRSTISSSGLRTLILDVEALSLLFPLHQSILVTLKYLTSTSLDPAEIQLLSTGLVNLALFTASPQTEILKALLWVGALCIFVSCQKPLNWEVRLARIPSWKFARNKAPRTGFMSLFEHIIGLILPAHRYTQSQSWSSDDEDHEHLKSARRMAKGQVRLRRTKVGGPQSDLEPTLKREENGSAHMIHGLQRSLTATTNGTHLTPLSHRRKNLVPRTGMLSLTYNQAQACKWLISGYVFSAVLVIILVVVRYYVSVKALSSYEPFGWAIGYLFGNIQSLRLWVVSNNLEMWIRLPGHNIHNVIPEDCGWVEQIRQVQLGPANLRLLIAAYCMLILTAGIGVVLMLGTVVEVDTRRKVFHGTMVAILAPTIFIDPCFIAMALSLILAIFLLLDLFRASQLPPISKPLTTFLAPYVDGRDYRGPVIVSPIFLLIGCAIPLWLSLAGAPRTGQDPWVGWDTDARELSMVSGVICVGMGDAAASLVGRRYGKTKWFWGGGKSLEGSLAFAVAVTVGLAACYIWLGVGGWVQWDWEVFPLALVKMAVAGSGASILESVLTAGNDNVIVPIGLWLLTRGLDI